MSYTDSELGRLVSSYESTRDRYWLTRHYLAVSTLVTFAIAVMAPGSLNTRAIEASGPIGWVVVAVLAVISLVALYEAFITAFVPTASCEWLRNRRHTVFMAIALGQLSLGYAVVLYAPGSKALLLRFALDATLAATVAYLDLFARHKVERAA